MLPAKLPTSPGLVPLTARSPGGRRPAAAVATVDLGR